MPYAITTEIKGLKYYLSFDLSSEKPWDVGNWEVEGLIANATEFSHKEPAEKLLERTQPNLHWILKVEHI